MYTKVESKIKKIKVKTYKQLTKKSLEQVIRDIKEYCDEEQMITFNDHDFGYIPISKELIRKVILEQEPDNYFINTKYKVFMRNPDYNPNYEEDEYNQELQTYRHSRWENDYEGMVDTWQDYLESVVNDYIYNHEDKYEWETIKVDETVEEED